MNKKLLLSENVVVMVFCGRAILAMIFHGLEARATLHKIIE